jgi:hypothetical protein
MPELPLDDHERHALAGHLDGVGVPELMRGEPAANAGLFGGPVELGADPGWCARTSACRASKDAEERADRQAGADLEPGLELVPCPAVHSDLATFASLAVPDEDRAAIMIQVGFGERERLTDSKTGAPEHDDQTAQTKTIGIVSRRSHHGDDLLNGRRVGRVA